ncbi:MAG: TerB family tellurite resistance protein, partial [Pseudomonadota bacterium]|nr:TerB family tellurite resistance protein [Pseudomonadota bacterium]
EIATATRIGQTLFSGFSERDFRTVLAAHRELPGPEELAALLKQALPEDGRAAVYRYLVAIASADGEMAGEEQTLLALVAGKLGLESAGGGHDERA